MRIGIQRHPARRGGGTAQIGNMPRRVHPQQVIISGQGGLDPQQVHVGQCGQNRIQPRHLFGMAGRSDMVQTFGMSDQGSCHAPKEQKYCTRHKRGFIMRLIFAAGFMLWASVAIGQDVLGVVKSDLDDSGGAEVFTLLDTGTGTADLQIDDTAMGTVFAADIAWVGGLGQIPTVALAENGSVQVTSMNDAVGRDRWILTLTIAYRNNAYRVAGYTYSWRDTLDFDSNGVCDVNLLTGRGELSINGGPKQQFSQSLPALPVTDWTEMTLALPPDACQWK